MLTVEMVSKFLQNQKCTSSGPGDLPYWFWKEFSAELASTITKIFNSSLRKGKIPNVWKRADLIPVPKEATLENCNQLRPISLTDIIMRIFEKYIYIKLKLLALFEILLTQTNSPIKGATIL